ncbi:hypothetical protein EV175_005730 [Coemansia sp. RSA 1933]|nr:hypothetical protein EV175_005730 [Coemansia sp. RSA 1933]
MAADWLSDEQLVFFRTHGYLVVPGFLSACELAMYRAESETLVNHCYEYGGDLVAHWGCVVEPLGCGFFPDSQITAGVKADRDKYSDLRTQLSPHDLVRCTLDKFGCCAQQLLRSVDPATDSSIFLLNEQYIVKPPHSDAQFAWHQDILYFEPEEQSHAIVSVWTPIDDVSLENGTVWVDPFPDPDRPGEYTRTRGTAFNSELANDGDPVFAAEMAAGSALFMDGRLRHCSTGNSSNRFRTVYMPQFSLGRIERASTGESTAFAIPVSAQ